MLDSYKICTKENYGTLCLSRQEKTSVIMALCRARCSFASYYRTVKGLKGCLDQTGKNRKDYATAVTAPKVSMNIRFSFFVAGTAWLLAAGALRAQTSIQRLAFSLVAEYQTNIFYTNTTESTVSLTNESSYTHRAFLITSNVIKALAVDVDGPNWTNWLGSALVREVNLTNGAEGIFLRNNGVQTNVSSFFGGSFSNNFTAGLSNEFPGATNFPGLTNTFVPQLQLDRGTLRMTSPTNTTATIVTTAGLYFPEHDQSQIQPRGRRRWLRHQRFRPHRRRAL